MKKLSTTKLSLRIETVRQLGAVTLSTVRGGILRTSPAVCVQPTEDCETQVYCLKPTIVKPL